MGRFNKKILKNRNRLTIVISGDKLSPQIKENKWNDIPCNGIRKEEKNMQVIDRALEILTILSKETNGLSVSGLAKKLSLPPSSIHRILASLKENNFIIQDSESRKYKIGYKLYTLCSNMSKNNILVNLAKPIMQKLSEEIQMTVVLCVMEENHIINIACIESDEHSMYMVKIGKQMPLYSTSAGRVFSAYMDRCTVKEIYENMDLKPSTPYTKTKIQELLEELDHIREKGYALIDEELQMGIQGVASPIFDNNKKVAAALALTSMKQSRMITDEIIEKLKQSADSITKAIS